MTPQDPVTPEQLERDPGAPGAPSTQRIKGLTMNSIVETAFTAAKEKINEIQPNDLLKLLGLQVLRSSGGLLFRLPIIAAFGGGLAIGAGTALFFSPKAGQDNRKAIVDWAKNALASVGKGANKAIEAAGDAVEGAEDALESAGDAVEDGVTTHKKKNTRAKPHAEA